MKIYIFLLFSLALQQNPTSEKFRIINNSNQNMELKIWSNSKLIYDLVLRHGDELSVSVGNGILLQWKFPCDRTDLYLEEDKILPNGWVECMIRPRFKYNGFTFINRNCNGFVIRA